MIPSITKNQLGREEKAGNGTMNNSIAKILPTAVGNIRRTE
jgi:hypothetical protein